MQAWPPNIQNGFYPGFMSKTFHTVSNTGAVGDDNTVMHWQNSKFPEEYLQQKMNENQWDGLWSAASMMREKSPYYRHDCDVAFCMGGSFEALHSY